VCRHLAIAGGSPGAPIELSAVLLDAPHALVTQVDHPRYQGPGITNRDGWGVAWHDGGSWRQHRSVAPLSEDSTVRGLVADVRSPAVLAAIRRASPGLALAETGNAPFVDGPWAFSLNGFVGGYADGPAAQPLRAALTPERRAALSGDTDTEVLFGLVLDGLDAGDEPGAALAAAVGLALDAAGGRESRLNLLLTDGAGIWATRWNNSLFHRRLGGGALVLASEPWDDAEGWTAVEQGRLVRATDGGVTVEVLAQAVPEG
jgi:glutamine amidotransferase